MSSVVRSPPPQPSGHPGGGFHLSISRCCPGQLFWSNVRPGSHVRWRQMLLYKHTGSQCGFHNKQTAFLRGRGATLQRKPQRTGTRCDTAWAVGPSSPRGRVHKSAQWGCDRWQSGTWRLRPPPTWPSAARCRETEAASVRLDRSIMAQFKRLYLNPLRLKF